MTLSNFISWCTDLEGTLTTGKHAATKHCAIAARRQQVLSMLNSRLHHTCLWPLLSHVTRYESFWVLGAAPAGSRCAVTGVESTTLRAIRFEYPLDPNDSRAMTCAVSSHALRALRFYYCWTRFHDLTMVRLWRTPPQHRPPCWYEELYDEWRWVEHTLVGLGVYVDLTL